MTARGLFSPVAALVSMTLAAGSNANFYFSQYEDQICTGTGTLGDSQSRTGVMTEFEWKTTPTSVTGCSGGLKIIKKGGANPDVKYYSLNVTCATDNSMVTIQTFRGNAVDASNHCKAGNEYYKYEVMSSQFANLRAGMCTNTTYYTSSGSTTSSNRSMQLSGWSSSLLCGLCGGSCSSSNSGNTAGSGGNNGVNVSTSVAPSATVAPGTTSNAKVAAGPIAGIALVLASSLCIAGSGF